MSKEKLKSFQCSYPSLKIGPYDVHEDREKTQVVFKFSLGPLNFQTTHTFPKLRFIDDYISQRLLTYLAIVEAFSYWKLTCPSELDLSHFFLSMEEQLFFKKLITKGMGEFLYRNSLPLDLTVDFGSKKNDPTETKTLAKNFSEDFLKGSLVLIGGGKDSVASLKLLSQLGPSSTFRPLIPFCVNPTQAVKGCINQSELTDSFLSQRRLDPQLKSLNQQGYFNGHIPFSAVLSFVSAFVAYNHGKKFVIVSNEASANQGNLTLGSVEINHQYSKTYEYERDVSKLFEQSGVPVRYFSLLRPLNEIQITKIFSECEIYHSVFQSCNIKQTLTARANMDQVPTDYPSGLWCGDCPKCVFVYLMLNLFLSDSQLKTIFGKLPSQQPTFDDTVNALIGESKLKPFECVGTFEEVSLAASKFRQTKGYNDRKLKEFLHDWNSDHSVPQELVAVIKQVLAKWS